MRFVVSWAVWDAHSGGDKYVEAETREQAIQKTKTYVADRYKCNPENVFIEGVEECACC